MGYGAEDEFLPAALVAIQGVQPGDEIHHAGQWHEVFTIETTSSGLLIRTSEGHEFLTAPMHYHRVRKPRPVKPQVSA